MSSFFAMSRPIQPRRVILSKQRGIALVEVLVAIVLLGVGLLGAIGLQAKSYSALADTGMRAEATIAADKLIGMMTTDQANLAAYARALNGPTSATLLPWYNETRAHIPNAAITVAVTPVSTTAAGQVTVTISWTRKATTGGAAAVTNTHTVTSYIAPAT
jgi:type IV pilus assembly protein PilV